MNAKYANAIALVRDHGYSVQKAARTLGISATHLTRKLNAIGTKSDLQAMADAGDRRILEMSQAMSMLSGEELLERIENDGHQMKTTELQKIYTASTSQVAVKQRWSQGSPIGPNDHGMSALAKMLVGHKLTLEPVDPAEQAIEVNAEPSTTPAEGN